MKKKKKDNGQQSKTHCSTTKQLESLSSLLSRSPDFLMFSSFIPTILSISPYKSSYLSSLYSMPLHSFISIIGSILTPSLLAFICPPPSLSPSLSPCQGVYICRAHGRVPNKVERIRGEKTALLPARVSLSLSLPLSFSLSLFSLFLTVDIFHLMYS